MRINFVLVSLLFLSASFFANGQSSVSEKSDVVYDPLFWKDQLNLKPVQSKKINDINIEFYQSLASSIHDNSSDPASLRKKLAQSLEDRSERIWNTFYPNQRKKWQRIMSENANKI